MSFSKIHIGKIMKGYEVKMTVQLSLFKDIEENKIRKSQFKDKCDICGEFDYLRGYNYKCICQKCKKEMEENKNVWKNKK